MNRSVIDWPTGVTVHHPDRCYNGYTLVHGRGPWDPVRGISAQQVDRWHLIDMKGQVVHEFYGNPATQRGSQLFERVANGHYISNGASITEQDWDGNIVWSLSSDFRGMRDQRVSITTSRRRLNTPISLWSRIAWMPPRYRASHLKTITSWK